MSKGLKDMSIEELERGYEKGKVTDDEIGLSNGKKVEVYGADNRWHECTYLCKSYANKGHHIIYMNHKPYECAGNMIRRTSKLKDNE
ncbi:hypothetical protein [Gracilimonas sp.]|uniref:hypothetical protein n=1 Tax=Gracilimonas sp. TaxID=1974203 RepID=UPI002871001B|nr:hypothetical protein [Gracilimonas sp.]